MNGGSADWTQANTMFLASVVAMVRERLAGLANAERRPAEWRWPHSHPEHPNPALMLLRDTFDLSEFETAILALCASHELDTGIGPLCARITDDPSRPWPTFALALQSFPPGAWEAVSTEGPLRSWRLVEIERRIGEPLALAGLRCDERILDFIKGLNRIDERIAALVSDPPALDGRLVDAGALASLTQLWTRESSAGRSALLFGAEVTLRHALAAEAATVSRRHLYQLDLDALPSAFSEAEQFICLWNREAALAPLALFIDASRFDNALHASLIRRFLKRANFPVAVGVDMATPGLAETLVAIPVTRLNRAEQRALWNSDLGPGRSSLAHRLAGGFDFSPAMIANIAALAPRDADNSMVWRNCLYSVRPRLDTLAQRIEPHALWDDLILPQEQQLALRQIIDQVHQRQRVYDEWGYASRMNCGLGVTALFAGESGTGKTMAAEVIAAELALNLYRIDLSSMVSKYIGETEKNLRQLFDAAEQGGVALLFDEADALFGKRSEIKDSHDRYANIEVNYLLQRIESFSGLAILATNLKSALNSAFLRRIRFVVRFPHPGPAERRRMWERVFPSAAPIDLLDYEQLGQLNLTGGHIAAAAMNAAFLAAAEDAPIGMRHILSAARAELVKLSRPIAEADFAVPPDPITARAAE